MDLVWKNVIGYEDLFQVSSLGEIYSKRTNKVLKQRLSSTGYYTLSTRIGGRKGKSICLKVHRLVAKAFIPNPDNLPFVNHINGDKKNNKVSNLEWCTHSENMKHAVALGLLDLKSLHESSRKLNKSDIDFIRGNYKPYCSKNGSRALAKKFNVNHQSILNIVNRKTYKDY